LGKDADGSFFTFLDNGPDCIQKVQVQKGKNLGFVEMEWFVVIRRFQLPTGDSICFRVNNTTVSMY
jgi:hypothetical protein